MLRITSKYWIDEVIKFDRTHQDGDMYKNEGVLYGRINSVSIVEDWHDKSKPLIRYFLDEHDDWVEEDFVLSLMHEAKCGAV